ncbi:MAG TPA: 4Fe-4S binding protein [bacterium]|nr:4Fe-4S binding protein [bacterium]HPS28693.1 4Fe-4S binding protein [bacterium]
MKEIKRRTIRFLIVCMMFAAIHFIYHIKDKVETDDKCGFQKEYGLKVFPGMENFKKIKDKCYYEVSDKSGNILGKILYVDPDEKVPAGYGGQFKIVIGINNDNKVAGVEMGRSNETPGFTEMIRSKGFFNQWNGLDLSSAISKKVDTVTGATMSTSSIKIMVQKNISEYLGEKIEIEQTDRFSYIFYISIVVLIYSLISFFIPKRTFKFRLYHLILLVIFMGFLGGYALSIETFKNSFISENASFLSLVLFVLALLLPLFTGKNFYCTQVCPFGALQELTGKIPAKKISIKADALKILNVFKKLFFLAVFIFLLFKTVDDYTVFEPFSAFQFEEAGIISILIASIMILASTFISKPWCRFFCPTGSLFNFIVEKPQSKRNLV